MCGTGNLSSHILFVTIIKSIGNVQFIGYCYAVYIERCRGSVFITLFEGILSMVFNVFSDRTTLRMRK